MRAYEIYFYIPFQNETEYFSHTHTPLWRKVMQAYLIRRWQIVEPTL